MSSEHSQTPGFELTPITPESMNAEELDAIVQQHMPFGRFKGRKLIDLPEPYLVWFKQRGFPEGELGRRLAAVYEIKVYGLEAMLRPLLRSDATAADEK